jgi:hypothetical protein
MERIAEPPKWWDQNRVPCYVEFNRWRCREHASPYQAVCLESALITAKRYPDVIRDFYELRPVCGEKLRLFENLAGG